MPGYKQWADGDLLTPADIDSYLMGQTVMRFASDAARTAALPSPVAGMRSYLVDTGLEYIFAGGVWAPEMQFVKKAGTETITSSAVLQNDDHFVWVLPVGTYRVEAFLHASGAAAGDVQTAWTFSGTVVNTGRSCFGPQLGTADVSATTMRSSGHGVGTAINYGLDAALATVIHEDLYLEVTVAGTLRLQWAQNASNGTGTAFSAASRVYVTRLA
jgi:hypothetical protein